MEKREPEYNPKTLKYEYRESRWKVHPTCREAGLVAAYVPRISVVMPAGISKKQATFYEQLLKRFVSDQNIAERYDVVQIGTDLSRAWLRQEERERPAIYTELREKMEQEDRRHGMISHRRAYQIRDFPWPPPMASAFSKVSLDAFNTCRTLADVAERLESAFRQAGYSETNYYHIPGGFALVSRLEQITADGVPMLEERWSLKPREDRFSVLQTIRAMFTAREGHYRITAFLVTDHGIMQDSGKLMDRKEAEAWVSDGSLTLPSAIGGLQFSKKYAVAALIYEFDRPTLDHDPILKRPSSLTGDEHLSKSGIMQALFR